MQTLWDVLIIGGGPAGGLAALDCAAHGLRVLLVEQRLFPRWKVCGCCFNSQAQAILNSRGQNNLIVDSGGQALQSLRLGLRGREATLALPNGFALSRERFDQALINAAIKAGATARFRVTAQVGTASPGYRSVSLKDRQSGATSHVKARVVLVAAGLTQRCLPQNEAGQSSIRQQSRHGAGCVVDDDSHHYPAGAIHMAIGDRGYVGLVRREDGLLNLAGAFDRDALSQGQGAIDAAQHVLNQAGFPVPAALQQGQRWQLTAALSRSSDVVAGERFLVMGDAAGYVEPFTGEGMAWALTAGAAAAPFVLEGLDRWTEDLETRWKTTLQRHIGRRQTVCRALSSVLKRQSPTALLFELVNRWPAMAEQIISNLNEVKLPSPKGEPCL
ncbi:NAD(P)/FAD-dependent oxidoreductase [Synechococcus sp. CC9311]|uniref:NAD(P)/FAD-dependent oxidoreductase n=1 Tax=Synechococcus sp. (strain CC9311) TaxID=64471 RepID=UPI0000DDAE9E|nr:FAD-dependent monooxygenase [Synechococcus sp. CC9311]ABI46932.1 NAD binding site [Synechococcus sp. CC9311]